MVQALPGARSMYSADDPHFTFVPEGSIDEAQISLVPREERAGAQEEGVCH